MSDDEKTKIPSGHQTMEYIQTSDLLGSDKPWELVCDALRDMCKRLELARACPMNIGIRVEDDESEGLKRFWIVCPQYNDRHKTSKKRSETGA